MLNSNMVHNVLNVLIAVSAGATAFLLATGCTTLPTGALECSASWLDPTLTTAAAAGMAVLKSVINIARDGFGGLTKPQPPVEKP